HGGKLTIDLLIYYIDGEFPSVRHCIPGIHDQIQDYLLHLNRINLYLAQTIINRGQDYDMFPDQAANHLVHTPKSVPEIDHPWLQDLFSAECQQLPGSVGRAVGSVLNLLKPVVWRILR